MRIRDACWLWGHEPGSHNMDWGLPAPSRITPVEAACYLNIPNLIMVRYGTAPLPLDAQYLVPFRTMRHMVWSVVGAGGTHQQGELDRVLAVCRQMSSTVGVIMDDFFHGKPPDYAVLSLPELQALRGKLAEGGQPLELWVVLYAHQLDRPVGNHLALCDKVTFWTWEARDVDHLERNFARFERLVPEGKRRVLGCYMWDYGQKRPMPLDRMKRQCELGLRWLTEGRIAGLIFLASCICDLGLETVEWTRGWLSEVRDQPIGPFTSTTPGTPSVLT